MAAKLKKKCRTCVVAKPMAGCLFGCTRRERVMRELGALLADSDSRKDPIEEQLRQCPASKMVIPYGEVGAQWWDAHFLSLDYGFGKSSASAHLHVRTQDGRIKTVGEFVASHLPAYEFSGEVVRRFVAPQTQGQRRRIVAVYLDPSNFKNNGDGHTIADQINEVLEPYDLGVLAASNDRIGGWEVGERRLPWTQWPPLLRWPAPFLPR